MAYGVLLPERTGARAARPAAPPPRRGGHRGRGNAGGRGVLGGGAGGGGGGELAAGRARGRRGGGVRQRELVGGAGGPVPGVGWGVRVRAAAARAVLGAPGRLGVAGRVAGELRGGGPDSG